MAESSSETGAPNLHLNAEEKRVYGQLFRQADTDNVGVVTGEIAVKFFEKTRLDSRVLGEIWQIADKENRGFLTPAGFGVVLRLIGHAQAGREPSPEMALQPGPLPRFDGIVIPPAPAAAVAGPAAPAAPISAQGTGSAPIRIPPLTPDKVAQYASLFERQPLQASMLPGEQAKQIFEKSGLPNETLGRIWMLADTEQRGALVLTEFVIAMHLLSSIKSGALRALPNILPAALYEAATRRGSLAGAVPRSPTAPTAPLSAIPRQLSGQTSLTQMRTGSPLGRPPYVAPVVTAAAPALAAAAAAAAAGSDWLVTPADKARFDVLYNELDKGNKGYITGEEAVTFFGQSHLPSETLATIWDLSDIHSEGQLNKDEFAVAMYLIRQQRTKPDGSIPLPTALPPNLIPPSMRSQVRPPTATSPFDAPPQLAPVQRPPPPQKPSAMDDLFGLDDPPPIIAAAQPQVALATGGSVAADPFASGLSPAALTPPMRPSPTGTMFKPFMPSSSFGRGLTSQTTGGSTGPASSVAKPSTLPSVEDDLLGDDDNSGRNIGNDATELANLSNQIGSLTKQVQDVGAQRSTAQNELSQAATQKKTFEQRLAQLRAMYDKEAQDVQLLQVKLTEAQAATAKLQKDMGMLNVTYQDLQAQHQQVLAALQADQLENAGLKERIAAVNAEVAQLKPRVERLRSEARQQKGLVAINKKQLATVEGERDKLRTETDALTRSHEETARQMTSGSPAPSSTSGNNPFFRRTGSTDITTTFPAVSPIKSFNERSFDDVFGPSVPASSGTPPPPAAVAAFNKPQTTGTSTASVASFATPLSTSPNVGRAEPPAPPESRQLSSTNLPFVDAPESLSSSRQVSPPMSRLGPDTPMDQPAGSAAVEATATGASAGSEATIALPAVEGKPTSNGTGNYFGAAASGTPDVGKPDPFGALDTTKAKDDFDAAFASFKSGKVAHNSSDSNSNVNPNNHEAPSTSSSAFPGSTTTGAASSLSFGANDAPKKPFAEFNTEFPPIAEFEHDDDSDSESERGGRTGFDDDFAPASPPPPPLPEKIRAGSAASLGGTGSEERRVVGGAAGAMSLAEPSAASELRPTTPGRAMHNTQTQQGPAVSVTPAAPAPAAAKITTTALDDLDDDFEGLEDAKEGSVADDDFATLSRSGLDDLNAVFDSRSSMGGGGQGKGAGAHSGHEVSFDLVSASSLPSQPSQPGGTTATAAKAGAGEPHDWDAIFASLDDAGAVTSPTRLGGGGGGGGAATERPAVAGRALTEEGQHDDPILKNLTSMGYARGQALAALEKYDYNLERAANYLANHS